MKAQKEQEEQRSPHNEEVWLFVWPVTHHVQDYSTQCGQDPKWIDVAIQFNLAPLRGVKSKWIETGSSADTA